MNTPQRYKLGKNERLKSRKAIEHLFKKGKYFSLFPFRVIYTQSKNNKTATASSIQTGFSVSTRHFKKAVDRNRVKRLMREAWRLQKNDLNQIALKIPADSQFNIFLIYTGNQLPDYKLTFAKIGMIIKKIQQLIDEQPEVHT